MFDSAVYFFVLISFLCMLNHC